MPWIVQKNGEKYCVFKKGADGEAEGDSLHCYEGDDAEERAKKYMKALYAHADDMQIHLSGDSLDQRATAVREGFVKSFLPQYQQPEQDSYCYIREIYDDYVIVDNGGKLYKVTYTKSDKELVFAPRDQWQAVKIDYVDMSFMDRLLTFLGLKANPRQDSKPHEDLWAFSFTELAASHKAIDGLAANDDDPYISMSGQEVYIKSGDLAAYIENTMVVIESTKTESGEIVGLPIDLEAHNHKGGAGWIVGLELDSARKVIRFLVNWTEKGIDLIKGNLSRFFSPSVDTENKMILGGSLTNWPASRNAKGQILLRPVELSQSIKEIDMEKTLLDMLAELPGKVAEAVRGGKPADPPPTPPVTELETEISPELKELLRTPEAIEALGKKSQEMAREAIHLEKRKMHTVHFASKLAGGTAEHPVGLKVRPNEVVALLLSLPEPQALAVEKILAGALDGAINFSMRGLDGNGFIQKPELPKEVKGYLKTWVEAGKTVDEFFKLNLELGNPEDYNLAEFAKKEA